MELLKVQVSAIELSADTRTKTAADELLGAGAVRELSQENSLVDLEAEVSFVEEKDELLHYLQWPEDNDYQNLYCQQVNKDKLDPLSRVGAESLSQCLELQLLRIRERGPVLIIVRNYLPPLAKRHYSSIAAKMNISVDQVKQAKAIIRELEPRRHL